MKIDEKTSLPLKIITPILLSVVSCAWWGARELSKVRASLEMNWTIHDQRDWSKALAQKNPSLSVPEPDDAFWRNRRQEAPGRNSENLLGKLSHD